VAEGLPQPIAPKSVLFIEALMPSPSDTAPPSNVVP
jgi:hypothetical protein